MYILRCLLLVSRKLYSHRYGTEKPCFVNQSANLDTPGPNCSEVHKVKVTTATLGELLVE